MYEMTGIKPKDSGLSCYIWISSRGNAKHGPRVKVSNISGKFDANDNFSITVSDNPIVISGKCKLTQDNLEQLKDWIKLNYKNLHLIWNSDIMDSRDHLEHIQKL